MAEQEEQEETTEPGATPDKQSGGFLARLKKAPPWVWIGLAVAVATLVVGYAAYRNSQAATNPAASGGSNSTLPPGSTGSGNDMQQEFQQLQREIQNLQREIHGGSSGGTGGKHKKKK